MPSSRETWQPVERLREIWTPEREVYEVFDKLEPGTRLDSIVRELFSRTVMHVGEIKLDVTDPVRGYVRWEQINFGSRKLISVWWQPEAG